MTGLRFVEIRGDSLEPHLRGGDFVMVAPASGWMGEGLYVTTNAYAEDAVYECSAIGTRAEPRVCLGSHLVIAGRKAYSDQVVSRAEFERIVTGKVVVTCRVRDRSLFHRHAIAA